MKLSFHKVYYKELKMSFKPQKSKISGKNGNEQKKEDLSMLNSKLHTLKKTHPQIYTPNISNSNLHTQIGVFWFWDILFINDA